MKLLMITGLGSAKDLASGRKGAFYNTLEEFSKYWERIDIIAPRVTNYELRIKNLFGNVYIHISPWPLIFHPIWFLKKGLEIYKEQKFELMTVNEFPPFYNGIGARLLWNRIKAPYVLEFHHIPGYPKAASLKEKIYAMPVVWKLYWRIFGSKAKAVRVVNQKQAPEFLVKAGMPENKIVYIPSMYIDLDVFKPTTNNQQPTTKQYDLIFVGRLEKNKGVDLLLEAVKKLKTYNLASFAEVTSATKAEQLTTLIVGDGPLVESLKFKVKNLKLGENVVFWGWAKDQNEIANLINKSKALIVTSYNEGGPRVVLEAMACGVPILATNVGLVSDLADKNAVKIIDWNAEDIAKKAKELLDNDNERDELSQAGLEIAKQFEKKAMIKNYAEQLKKLLHC